MKYKIAETFYSVQGEGEWAGTAAFFIRLAGCNLKCDFCDTDYTAREKMSIEELVAISVLCPARKVVITGGEPCLQDTQPLVVALRKEGFKVHLETNGTCETHSDWDWITISPKPGRGLIRTSTVFKANEFKFLCGIPNWREFMEAFMKEAGFDPIKADNPIVWLMPLAKSHPSTGLLEHTTKEAFEYVLKNPRVKLCIQIHKVIGAK